MKNDFAIVAVNFFGLVAKILLTNNIEKILTIKGAAIPKNISLK